MQNRYKHVLKAEDLRTAAKKNPEGSALPLEELYTDKVSAKSRETGEWEGLKTFYKDAGRDVKINGNNIMTKIPDFKPDKAEEKSEQFLAFIDKELGIDPSTLDVAYGQNLQSILTHPLAYNNQIGMGSGRSFSLGYTSNDSGREANVYRENEDVYCKIKIREYHVSQSFQADPTGEGKNLLLPGPVEVLYKLVNDPNDPTRKLFALQHIATDSDFIRDIFLAKKEGLVDQLKKELVDVTPATLLKNIDTLLKAPKMKTIADPQKNQLMQEVVAHSFGQASEAVSKYEKSEISADQLVEALEKLKPGVAVVETEVQRRQSFIKRHFGQSEQTKPATHALQQAIDNAKKLPEYKVVPVDAKTNTNKENIAPSDNAPDKVEPVRIVFKP